MTFGRQQRGGDWDSAVSASSAGKQGPEDACFGCQGFLAVGQDTTQQLPNCVVSCWPWALKVILQGSNFNFLNNSVNCLLHCN